jgi:hypothetical protein
MTVLTHVLAIVASALSLIVVVELLRRRHLRERHAIWWFIASVLALIVSIFPSTLVWVANLIGIEVPINLVFFVSVAVLFFVCLQLSSEVTRLEASTRTLAEIIALHELRIKQLEQSGSAGSPPNPRGTD